MEKQICELVSFVIDSNYVTLLSMETNFTEIGLDSITFIRIVVALEEKYDFEFDDEMLLITKFPTVRSMVEYVESKVTANCANT